MAVNDLTISQMATLANSLLGQAAGTINVSNINDTMVTVAQATLKTGYDPVIAGISQVLTKTLFAVRPYSGMFRTLIRTDEQYGNHVRKINIADRDLANDDRYDMYDSNGDYKDADQYAHRKPKVLQTNYYGQNADSIATPIYGSQFGPAWRNEAELRGFLSSIETSSANTLKRQETELARLSITNAIAAAKSYSTTSGASARQYINLIREWNIERGTNTTANVKLWADVKRDEALKKDFAKYMCAYVKRKKREMKEYGVANVQTIKSTPISRQSSDATLKGIFHAEIIEMLDTYVKSDVHHPEFLGDMSNFETVSFWQGQNDPMKIMCKPWLVTLSTGAAAQASANVTCNNVVGVLFDEDAVGINVSHEKTLQTPWNARKDFAVIWNHVNKRMYNDLTENFVAFTVEDYTPA